MRDPQRALARGELGVPSEDRGGGLVPPPVDRDSVLPGADVEAPTRAAVHRHLVGNAHLDIGELTDDQAVDPVEEGSGVGVDAIDVRPRRRIHGSSITSADRAVERWRESPIDFAVRARRRGRRSPANNRHRIRSSGLPLSTLTTADARGGHSERVRRTPVAVRPSAERRARWRRASRRGRARFDRRRRPTSRRCSHRTDPSFRCSR